MDPAEQHQVLARDVVKQGGLVDGFARIAGTFLLGDDHSLDEERVGDKGSAKHAACFQVLARVGLGDSEKLFAQGGREEDCA